jgi:GNAT superfamily N-acetyltransferase
MRAIMNDDVFIKKGYQIATDKSLLNIEVIYKYLNEDSYWAQGIPFERLTRAIENSLCFGVYNEQAFVGFARVVTDKASFAYICDVFILPEFRGAGLSKWLIQTIVEHPELQGLRRWSLATSDAHGLYSQFGFSSITKPEVWMEIFKPYQPVKKEGN